MIENALPRLAPAPSPARADQLPAKTDAAPKLHVLQSGEDPASVADQHGVTEPALREANDLGPGQAVYPGTALLIPPRAAPAAGDSGTAQSVEFKPAPPPGEDGGLQVVPDFKSMSREAIQKYLKSPEFKEMAANERQVAEQLYNAGMKEAAAKYLADKMKDMPPEVAARFATECKDVLGQLARDAAGDKQLQATLGSMMSRFSGSIEGQQLMREVARNLAGAMSDQQVREFLQALHQGASDSRTLKILVLKELQSRVENGTLRSVQALELRNGVAELVKEVYQAYKSAQDAKAAKDKEFFAMLVRLGNSLTNEQKQELYRKFISDPANAAIYERAASTAAPMAEVVAVAARDVVATLLNRYELSDIPDLIGSLARYGEGIAAVQVLIAVKAVPAALAQLEKSGIDVAALERTAGASALAQTTVQNEGDVKSGLQALLEALKGSFDGVDGVIGKLEKLLALFPEGRCPNARELAEILDETGPFRNLVGGILSMTVALTASSRGELDNSMRALIELGVATTDTAGGIVAILSHFASESGKFAAVLEGAAITVKFLGKTLGVLLSLVSVGESLERQMQEGKLNWADMFNIASGMVAIAAAIPTPASPFLAVAAVVLSIAGQVIGDFVDEQQMQAEIRKYLGQIGFEPSLAEVFAANPDSIKQLVDAGFDPGQVAALARRFPGLLSSKGDMLGLGILIDALKGAGLQPARIMDLLSATGETGLRHFVKAAVISPEWRAQLAKSRDQASLAGALEKLLETAPTKEARTAIQEMLEQLETRS
ncbi:LysM peptidoglycan-binding domain-containing protein [Luteimonas aquatica]|uniref:LysM peptidoglycan-binding domain-containing protein n=1 Tax=Luteimonas aquatica TaxID=450364 RepID=UPI001F58019D|nr:LysM domain-containing protein [Luteimonas aquatica]